MEGNWSIIGMMIVTELILLLGISNLLDTSKYKTLKKNYFLLKSLLLLGWLSLLLGMLLHNPIISYTATIIINSIYTFKAFTVLTYILKKRTKKYIYIYTIVSLIYIASETYFFNLNEYIIVSSLHSEWLIIIWSFPLILGWMKFKSHKGVRQLVLIIFIALIPHFYRYYLVFSNRYYENLHLFTTAYPSTFFPFLLVLSYISFIIASAEISTEIDDYTQYLMYDFLTNALSRRAFWSIFEEKVEQAFPFSFSILDLDDFKKINDTYGHLTGDIVLKTVSKTINDTLPEDAVLGRIGGEEFAILFDSTSKNYTEHVLEKVRVAVSEITIKNNIKISISIGSITVFDSTMSTKHIYQQADENLYLAKKNGKNKISSI